MEAVEIKRKSLSKKEQKIRDLILRKISKTCYNPIELWRELSGEPNTFPSHEFRNVLWRLISEDEIELRVGNKLSLIL